MFEDAAKVAVQEAAKALPPILAQAIEELKAALEKVLVGRSGGPQDHDHD